MVGDICDEDELKTGYRAEGSFYSIFWWFIKLGTALASFVAGALIVFTLFDETQVTKVDKIQGSIRELRGEVLSWGGEQAFTGSNTELIETTKRQASEALEESKEYMTYLEKESIKLKDQVNPSSAEYQSKKQSKLTYTINSTQNNISQLEQLQIRMESITIQSPDSIVNAIATEAIPLTLQPKLDKAKMSSFELMNHLETKLQETKKSKEHYQVIMQKMTEVDNSLANMNTALSLNSLDQELGSIENEIVPLTTQSPYTLLMMRVVEIGLPLLLSIFSVFFVIRYSLTEKRSHEIKDLLKQRNLERSKEENNDK